MSEPIAQKLLFVGWDAADWEMIHPLLDAGRMPNLKRLVEEGPSAEALDEINEHPRHCERECRKEFCGSE